MIDLPWDDKYLMMNLEVLARLKPGDELSVLKDGDQSSIAREQIGNIGEILNFSWRNLSIAARCCSQGSPGSKH